MRFQNRDGIILSTICNHDGILTQRHLKEIFWPNKTLRAAQNRLAKLAKNDYLARPSMLHWKTQPIPEPIYWLDWRGILWIAAQNNLVIKPLTSPGENQMRQLAKQLRDKGLHWLREPRWHQLTHDISVIDFQLHVERDVAQSNKLFIEMWHHESAFRSDSDVVKFQLKDRYGNPVKKERYIYPDSFFIITTRSQSSDRQDTRSRFFLELDNATHPNARFGRDKVAPGIAYIKSQVYSKRFGDNSGRWLVITTGAKRMKNLMKQTRNVGGLEAGTFLFTTMELLKDANVLNKPIWWQVGKVYPIALII